MYAVKGALPALGEGALERARRGDVLVSRNDRTSSLLPSRESIGSGFLVVVLRGEDAADLDVRGVNDKLGLVAASAVGEGVVARRD